jgi:TetR/AcrR family transcriptional regulator, repressor for neighboring sulfatase
MKNSEVESGNSKEKQLDDRMDNVGPRTRLKARRAERRERRAHAGAPAPAGTGEAKDPAIVTVPMEPTRRERRSDRRAARRSDGRATGDSTIITMPMARTRRRDRIRPLRALRTEGRRRRRAPELARVEILDAAERVFIEFQPDQVGLKDVARAAGVSHALITHYFGTYAGLIEAALERRIRTLRETMLSRLREAGALARPAELLTVLFRGLEDPVHLRLTKWLLASERPSAAHAFALRDHGLQLVAHQVAAALDPRATPDQIGTIEMALLAAVSAAYGYAIGKYALAGALGREPSIVLDEEVLKTLAAMVETYLRAQLGAALPVRSQ